MQGAWRGPKLSTMGKPRNAADAPPCQPIGSGHADYSDRLQGEGASAFTT